MTKQTGTSDGGRETGDVRTSLDDLRDRIDGLDAELVRLLNARAACALSIGRLKRRAGMEIYQPDRERDVLKHVREINTGPLAADAIVRLFERIIDEARRLERAAEGAGDGRERTAARTDG